MLNKNIILINITIKIFKLCNIIPNYQIIQTSSGSWIDLVDKTLPRSLDIMYKPLPLAPPACMVVVVVESILCPLRIDSKYLYVKFY